MKGRVYQINRDRGFAFARDEEGYSRFLNVNDFTNKEDFETLVEGQSVEFEPRSDGTKGNRLRGVEVRKCSS